MGRYDLSANVPGLQRATFEQYIYFLELGLGKNEKISMEEFDKGFKSRNSKPNK